MKIEMINVGWLTAAAGIWRRDDDMDRRIRFPIPAYVIETDTERILVDTGLNPGAARGIAAHYGKPELAMFELEQEASVADRVDLATVTKVVITHLHFDHAGGMALLPRGVPIVIQRREWEAAHDSAAIARAFLLPQDYASASESRLTLIDGDHDLLGDGSITLLSTPGHTAGHQSVKVGDDLVLGVDVSHFASGLDDHRFPMFADDFEHQARSAARLKELRDHGARVIPGHDPEVLEPGPVA